jgi:hypothetical protein
MVFVWGTTYKLSLYKAGRERSPAKVCTRGSDAAKNALEQATDGTIVVQTPIRVTGIVDLLRSTGDSRFDRLRDQQADKISFVRQSPILYFRPPPDGQLSL